MSAGAGSGAPQTQDLQGSAASAALYATRDAQSSHPFLDEHGRLSAASAATSLKHARAQDLPSFPSQGGVKLASAGAAASLANDNHKTFEHWKPKPIPAANKAAMQAKDYKMNPLWQPELSAAGSRAALQAHSSTTSPEIWKASESGHGLSAAGQAHAARKATKPITEREVSASDHRKALLAATGAMASSRKRSDSAPIQPQPSLTAGWALKAATSTHKTSNPRGEFASGDPGFEAARVQNIAKNNVSRQMYGSTPPVSIEVEEKKRQDMLRASAVAMAQKMYAIQQSHINEAKSTKLPDSTSGARAARNRAMSDSSSTYSAEPVGKGYENLQQAATRLAQERLAKLHDEHAEYRSYYGQSTPQKTNRLSIRGHRRQTSNANDSDDSDEEQSRKIRTQMSVFQTRIAEVDTKKRQADRDALLQAAHKNVTAQLNKLDEKVFSETGKVSPQQRELWERQARERAQRESDDRMVNVGRVHIGGGKYLEQSEIDAIAKQRLQPTLDEIADKAEKQRARDEEIRLEQERIKQEQETEKQRQADIKKELKDSQAREKQKERARRDEEKRVQREEATATKEKRQTEAATEKEKARLDREEKRKSQGKKPGFFSGVLGRSAGAAGAGTLAAGGTGAAVATSAADTSAPATADTASPVADDTTSPVAEDTTEPTAKPEPEIGRPITADSTESTSLPAASPSETSPKLETVAAAAAPNPPAEESPASPSKRDSRIKSFFGRFRGKSHSAEDEDVDIFKTPTPAASDVKKSTETDASRTGEIPRSDSMRDVALAGRKTRESEETDDMYGDAAEHQAPDSPVSPVKETYHDRATAVPATSEPAPAASRGRSPSISSLSSSNDERPATTAAAAGEMTSPTSPTAEDGRGRQGFRQRLLKKVKPASGGGGGVVSLPGKSKLSKNKEPTTTIASDKETAATDGVATPPATEATSSNPIASDSAAAATLATTGKKSQDTEEREEARDAFKEEVSLAPPKKLADAARNESPRGSREGSRFHEEL